MSEPTPDKKWRVNVVKGTAQPQEAARYADELASVLRDRDVFKFRHFLAAKGRPLPDEMMLDPLKLATMLHQLILNLPQLADLHDFSRQWLNDNTGLPKNGQSLSEAAKRPPGEMPAPEPGRRVIALRPLPPSKN